MSTGRNNKLIVKNTIMLYLRMLVVMGITFYTSRLILIALGIVDYGIYNVVGGVVAMCYIFNNALSASTQRYITFALGKEDEAYLKKVFANSISAHVLLAIIVFFFIEVGGLWMLYNKLVIPVDRMMAAFWVLQSSILSICFSIWTVPYNAVIIAHEKMSAFAYISLIEVGLKLVVIIFILHSNFDRLILYAISLFAIQCVMRIIYGMYSYHHFQETREKMAIDIPVFKDLSKFALWNLAGSSAQMIQIQGINIILNIFFGPVVNAARGIALQVQNATSSLAANIQTAINPQITKSYASGDQSGLFLLVEKSGIYAFFLLLVIILPLFLETSFILGLWLAEVPKWTVPFVRITLVTLIFEAMSDPLTRAVQATGNIKYFQMTISVILLLILPISYFILDFSHSPQHAFIVQLIMCTVAYFTRIGLTNKAVHLPFLPFIKNVFGKCTLVAFAASIVPIAIISIAPDHTWRHFIVIFSSILCTICSIFQFGLSRKEKDFVFTKVRLLTNSLRR